MTWFRLYDEHVSKIIYLKKKKNVLCPCLHEHMLALIMQLRILDPAHL